MKKEMSSENILKIFIQLISMYRSFAMFFFILYYTKNSNLLNSFIIISAILSDSIDGFLARKYHLESIGGQLLDLFSDKYLTFISILFLIIQEYPLFPLLIILTKEIFVLSFRSITLNGEFVISTHRKIGGLLSGTLWITLLLEINDLFIPILKYVIWSIGICNFIYVFYKISFNHNKLKQVFKS